MTVLKRIPKVLSPRLLHILASMGHGDEIVLAGTVQKVGFEEASDLLSGGRGGVGHAVCVTSQSYEYRIAEGGFVYHSLNRKSLSPKAANLSVHAISRQSHLPSLPSQTPISPPPPSPPTHRAGLSMRTVRKFPSSF
jgi:hypothetical protein